MALSGLSGYYKAKEEDLKALGNNLKKVTYRYLAATTANKFQKEAREVLEKNGFKQIITFYSSHSDKSETLTFWFKEQKKYDKNNLKNPVSDTQSNCSVNYNADAGVRIFTGIPKDAIAKFQNGKNLKRIGKTPMFFHVRENEIIGKVLGKNIKAKAIKPVDKLYNAARIFD